MAIHHCDALWRRVTCHCDVLRYVVITGDGHVTCALNNVPVAVVTCVHCSLGHIGELVGGTKKKNI